MYIYIIILYIIYILYSMYGNYMEYPHLDLPVDGGSCERQKPRRCDDDALKNSSSMITTW